QWHVRRFSRTRQRDARGLEQRRCAKRHEYAREQLDGAQSRPVAVTVADRGIEAAAGEVLRLGREVELHDEFRVPGTEGAEPRREPARAEAWKCRQRQARGIDVGRTDEA